MVDHEKKTYLSLYSRFDVLGPVGFVLIEEEAATRRAASNESCSFSRCFIFNKSGTVGTISGLAEFGVRGL